MIKRKDDLSRISRLATFTGVNRDGIAGSAVTSASGNPAFDYMPGRPNHFRMMLYKQEILARGGPKQALTVFRQTFGWPRNRALRRLPILSERDFAESNGVVFHETEVAGIPFINEPPPVTGRTSGRALHGITRSQYVACLHEARTRGRSAAILVNDQILLDFQAGELERVDEEFSWDPSILQAEETTAIYLEAKNECDPLMFTEAFNLLGAHTDFFGHWMCEYLPRLCHACISGLLAKMPLLIDADMPLAHKRSLEILFPDLGPIIEIPSFTSVLVDWLWVAPDISYYALYDAGVGRFEWDAISVASERIGPVIQELRRRYLANTLACSSDARRVFLARKPFRHRRLVNDNEIYCEAQSKGFIIIYPEDLSFDEQLDALRAARLILVQEGSASFLAQFAQEGARICMLSHPMTEPLSDWNTIFKASGLSLSVLTGPIISYSQVTPHDSSYKIEREHFTAFLEEWLGMT